ncbi:MAG: helix-turn-helix domain-containing protein, partial [Actinobacteria bacterium]|nr:helix-turn-helix domain-containing protein [Actinomycetota bacterium]
SAKPCDASSATSPAASTARSKTHPPWPLDKHRSICAWANSSERRNAESVTGRHGIEEAPEGDAKTGSHWRSAHGVHSADLDRGEQIRGLPQGRGEPADGHALAVRPDGGPRFGRGAGVSRVATSGSWKGTCARSLSEHERVLIGDGLRDGATMTRIAADLGRAPSTITEGIDEGKCPLALGIVASRRTRRRRRAKRLPGSRRGGGPRDMTMLDERPSQAADRVEAGHGESQWRCQAVIGRVMACSM